jgi:hypothetical protein
MEPLSTSQRIGTILCMQDAEKGPRITTLCLFRVRLFYHRRDDRITGTFVRRGATVNAGAASTPSMLVQDCPVPVPLPPLRFAFRATRGGASGFQRKQDGKPSRSRNQRSEPLLNARSRQSCPAQGLRALSPGRGASEACCGRGRQSRARPARWRRLRVVAAR